MTEQLPKSNDLATTWAFVEPGLQLIIGGSNDNSNVTPQMYMNVYSAIYNYCVNKSRTPQNLSSSNASSQSSLLVGAEIYQKLKDYLHRYVESLCKQSNESFLEFYVKRWKRYTLGAGYLNHVFDYMNRYWVQKERSDGRRDIFDVNTLALLTWRDVMFKPNVEVLIKEILEQVKLQRNNQVIDTGLLSVAIRSFVQLGIDVQDLKKPSLTIYIDYFEKPFMDATRQFYTAESAEYLSSHNIVDYMRKAEQRINEEESRESLYLDEHSNKPLTETLNDVLIVAHAQTMYDEFYNLLDQDHIDHISKMFKLMSRVTSTLTPLSKQFTQYVETQGLKAIENLEHNLRQQQQPGKPFTIDPKLYIKALIQVYKDYQGIVHNAFQDHPIFIKALDNACRQYINFNTLAKNNIGRGSSTVSSSKTPELLAKYSDNLLKKNKDADATSDMSVDDIMTIFKFLADKDAFETHYRRLLAKRLIHSTSSSEEAEETIIQRLQTENSMEYTSKITKMFQDIRASHELKILFKEETMNDRNGIVPDFEPIIITETMWPFNYVESNFQLPMDLAATHLKLEEIYAKKHNGRVLKWHWSLGRGEIKANLQKPGKLPFTFSMTMYQMAILLPFNEENTYTIGQLLELTGLELSTFQNSVSHMIKVKLLIANGTMDDLKTTLTLATDFKSKRLKINFAQGLRNTEAKQDQADVEREINEDRKNYLKACIVRIMKARKLLQHNKLMNEVIQQSHQRFIAKVTDIKKCIDELVDQEYLRRNEDQSYDYLA